VKRCAARSCNEPLGEALHFMCREHWRMVPPPMRVVIWTLFREQRRAGNGPTQSYLRAAKAAIDAVAARERREASA